VTVRAALLLTLAVCAAASIDAQSPFDSARGEAARVAQDKPQPTFRTGVELITVEASVLDGDGRPVADLGPDDFVVTRVRSVTRASTTAA